MATKKQKASTHAPASKKPGALDKKAALLQKREAERLARIEKRASHSAENKARHAAHIEAAKKLEVEVMDTTKNAGKKAAFKALPNGANPLTQKGPGRPWLEPQVEWTEELGRALFALISTGHGMKEISEMNGMPPLFQMLTWLGESTHPFSEIRARGKELLVPFYEEMAHSIAMNSVQGVVKIRRQVVTRDGDIVWTSERRVSDNTERAKLALQGIQWTLGHLKPKKHGRNPDQSAGTANEQLKGLFDALKAGPVD